MQYKTNLFACMTLMCKFMSSIYIYFTCVRNKLISKKCSVVDNLEFQDDWSTIMTITHNMLSIGSNNFRHPNRNSIPYKSKYWIQVIFI